MVKWGRETEIMESIRKTELEHMVMNQLALLIRDQDFKLLDRKSVV